MSGPSTSLALQKDGLFERSGRTHQERAPEAAIMLELERRGFDVAYLRTPEGYEVDVIARRAGDVPLLIQSCLDSEGDETWAPAAHWLFEEL